MTMKSELMGIDFLGFDWMSLASGAGGALSSFGGGDKDKGAAEAARLRAEEERLKREKEDADRRSRTTLYVALGIGVTAVLGGGVWLLSRKKHGR